MGQDIAVVVVVGVCIAVVIDAEEDVDFQCCIWDVTHTNSQLWFSEIGTRMCRRLGWKVEGGTSKCDEAVGRKVSSPMAAGMSR